MGAAILPETTCRHGRRHLAGIYVSAWAPPSCRKPRVGMGASILPETTCLHQRRHLSEPRGYPDALDAPPRDAAGLTRTGISFRPPGTRGKCKNPCKNREKRSGHGGRHLAGNHVLAWAPPSCRKPRVGMGAAILPDSTCRYGRRHLAGNHVSSSAPPSIRALRLPRRLRCPSPRRRRPHANRNIIPAPGDPRKAQKSRQKSRKKSGHGGRHLAGNHVSSSAPPSIRALRLPRRLRCPSPRRRRPHANRNIIPAPGDPRKAQKSRQKSRKNIRSWGPPSCRKPRVGMGAAIYPSPEATPTP
ncbi:uncharacterized protein LOC141726023 [Zonotrichia albicollis]|uniref:uncharacterized protein LOC141726023 n=1 Tax=Zonotrichia albicollis TaxID=44394 RepID=UPI003D80D571